MRSGPPTFKKSNSATIQTEDKNLSLDKEKGDEESINTPSTPAPNQIGLNNSPPRFSPKIISESQQNNKTDSMIFDKQNSEIYLIKDLANQFLDLTSRSWRSLKNITLFLFVKVKYIANKFSNFLNSNKKSVGYFVFFSLLAVSGFYIYSTTWVKEQVRIIVAEVSEQEAAPNISTTPTLATDSIALELAASASSSTALDNPTSKASDSVDTINSKPLDSAPMPTASSQPTTTESKITSAPIKNTSSVPSGSKQSVNPTIESKIAKQAKPVNPKSKLTEDSSVSSQQNDQEVLNQKTELKVDAKLTVDETIQKRVSDECPKGILLAVCREKIRWQMCNGHWSPNPQEGASACKQN